MVLDPVSHLLLDEAALPSFPLPTAADPVQASAAGTSHHTVALHDIAQTGHMAVDDGLPESGSILVIDAPSLANRLHAAGHPVRAYCDDLRDERALTSAPLDTLSETSLADVSLVLLRLPKSLGMLEDYAQRIAAFARPEIRLLAGGREKHLTRNMNEVLGRSFGTVRASLGRQKSRVLHASEPIPGELSWPHRTTLGDLALVSHAGAFAADKLDGGTRLLLQSLRESELPPLTSFPRRRESLVAEGGPRLRGDDSEETVPGSREGSAVDLGCGTGILATALARQGYDVLAIDVSRAACASARDTAAANHVQLEVERTDRLGRPPSTVDLVVCNPPFHRGTTKDSTPGFDLIRSAISALTPGAEFWAVFNSHLPYLPFLRTEIGPTRVMARDRHYTVTRSRRPQ